MPIKIFETLIQGTPEWLDARRGLMTASEMKLVLTPTLKIANNEKTRAHVWELAAQRISGYTEPTFIGSDMLRGMDDEIDARNAYREKIAAVEEIGFITNDAFGCTIGYSPDGLVYDRDAAGNVIGRGAIECKGRRQKFQIETIATGIVPEEFMLQLQTGMLVAELDWIDFVSYSGGLPMCIIRVYPDPVVRAAIIQAAVAFEASVKQAIVDYKAALEKMPVVIETERRIIEEMYS